MKKWIKPLILWGLLIGLLIYFIQAEIVPAEGYQKLRVETRGSGHGFVVRMIPGSDWQIWKTWEIWKMENRVESKKLLPDDKGVLFDELFAEPMKRLKKFLRLPKN